MLSQIFRWIDGSTPAPNGPLPDLGATRIARVAPIVLAALGVAALVAFGILGVGPHGTTFGLDLGVFWAAGLAWSHGVNPYDHAALSHFSPDAQGVGFFAYPPNIAPLCLLLGAFPFRVAVWVTVVANVVALLTIDGMCQRIRRQVDPSATGRSWVLTAIVFGNPFSSQVTYLGQTPLIALAACLCAWRLAAQGKDLPAGVLLGLACFKPQIGMLIVVWFVFDRRLKLLAAAGATVAASSILPAVASGGWGVAGDWFHAMTIYSGGSNNSVGSAYVFGLASLLDAMGVQAAGVPLIAAVVFAAVWYLRRRMVEGEIVAVLLAAPLLFIFAHYFDLVGMLPFVAVFIGFAAHRRSLLFVGACLLGVMFVPAQLVRFLGSPLLNQFRVPVVLAAMSLWVALRVLRREGGSPSRRGVGGAPGLLGEVERS